ncbi:MAG: hypothetical protein II981_03325 [Bacteroidales bacterium]|nr:hypothetical protein [Bacteroidales bacterium]
MELLSTNLERVNIEYLKRLHTVEGDLELKRRIIENDKIAVNYFLNDFSIPMLDYIGKNIMKEEGVYHDGKLCYYITILGAYYEYIGKRFIECIDKGFIEKKPEWHKISLYTGYNTKGKECRLFTYVSCITIRYFVSVVEKEKKERDRIGLLENDLTKILKDYNGFDEIILEETYNEESEIEWAWKRLSKKDQLILQYLVIEDRESLEIFDEMIKYVETKLPVELYTKKQKQDAMSLLKNRAKVHLGKLILQHRKKHQL